MRIKKPFILIIAIVICQLAGIIGTFFTTSAIPTWYVTLNKPVFNPPSWIFGPVWTLLYTLMGISVYKVWLKNPKKKEIGFAVKIFAIHLLLNSIWSIIFFGAKNLGLAFVEIVILWAMTIYTTKLFWKIEKTAGILLLPYIAWVSFAMILNLSIWTLNPKSINVYALADTVSGKVHSDYIFTKDKYQNKLSDFNEKKDSYLKNPTLSLKEEARLSFFDFLLTRNDFINIYLTVLKEKVNENLGLSNEQKNILFTKVDEELQWYENHKNSYSKEDTLENLLTKSYEEDERLAINTTPTINFYLVYIGFGNIITQENKHTIIYNQLKNEANSLVSLGRADSSLFERWFLDIEAEFEILKGFEGLTIESTEKLNSKESYNQKKGFQDSIKNLEPAKQSLLKINNFLYELENVIDGKR